MLARPSLAALLVGLALRLPAQSFEYAAGSAQYRVTQKTKVSQDVMGNKTEGESNATQLFTMTLSRPSRDTVLAVYVIDSIAATTIMGGPAPFLDRYKGLKVEVRTTPTATVVYSAKASNDSVPNVAELVRALSGYLPRMRATLARGSTWADTTSGKVTQFGIELDRKVISRSEVLRDTTVNGVPAWKIQRRDSTTIAGSGNGQSGPMTMEGTSLGRTTFVMTAKGLVLGADGTESSNVRVVLSSNGMEIGITTSAETKVEKVK